MASNIDQVKSELQKLVYTGGILYESFAKDLRPNKEGAFQNSYEEWYTEARRVTAQLVPERLDDFTSLYKLAGSRKAVTTDNYRIVDFLHGAIIADPFLIGTENMVSVAQNLFGNQVQILKSAELRLSSSLMDIREVLAADLFDSELEKALVLHKNDLLREAGVIAGVVLESHLQNVAKDHSVKITKKNPSIGELNDPLKDATVYDVPTWRLIQRLGDIRNLCDHKKERDPKPDEVLDLINGTEKITKTVY